MPVELKGLKGLDGLLRSKSNSDIDVAMIVLPIDALRSSSYQPRAEFDKSSLEQLAASISSQGIIQPLIVRRVESDKYEIIAGERRWRAAQIVGLNEIPVIIRNVPDNTALAFALIENIQREDLNPIDQAISLSRMGREFSMTHEEVAKTVGFSRSKVTNLLRLLLLPASIKRLLQQKKLEMGHARALLTLDEERQLKMAKEIIEKSLSVRETEKIIHKIKQPKLFNSITGVMNEDLVIKAKQWSETLTNFLSSPVKVRFNQSGNGRVVIKVASAKEVELLITRLKK